MQNMIFMCTGWTKTPPNVMISLLKCFKKAKPVYYVNLSVSLAPWIISNIRKIESKTFTMQILFACYHVSVTIFLKFLNLAWLEKTNKILLSYDILWWVQTMPGNPGVALLVLFCICSWSSLLTKIEVSLTDYIVDIVA